MCMILWMIRLPCVITDQLAVGTQNCFSTPVLHAYILTLKQAPRVHQNAPLPDKKSKKIGGGGTAPCSDPSPTGRGIYPLLRHHPSAPSAPRFALGVPVPFHLRLEHWLPVGGNRRSMIIRAYIFCRISATDRQTHTLFMPRHAPV